MSWKQYGGSTQLDTNNLNINTLSVDNIILRKAYAGNFDICGSLVVNTDVYVDRNMYVRGNSNFNNTYSETLIVQGATDFYGDVHFHGTFNSRGNVLTQDSIESIGNTTVGMYLFMNNHTNIPSSYPYFYATSSGIGINRSDASAALDIYSPISSALNVKSQNYTSRNILSRNQDDRGIVFTSTNTYSGIDFFVKDPISSSRGSSYIYTSDQDMFLHSYNDIHMHGNIRVNSPVEGTHSLKNESLLVYDNHSRDKKPFYPEIYFDDTTYTTNSLTLASSDPASRSVTMAQISNKNHIGAGIGAGNYPHEPTKAMMIKGLSFDQNDTFVPTEITVQGSSNVKYKSTLGINTYKPKIDETVFDINGPMRIDNSDINRVLTTDFQVKYLNHSRISSNTIMAVGTSNDISGSFQISGLNYYRHKLYFSHDFGKTWNQQTIYPVGYDNPSTPGIVEDDAVMNGDYLNQVDLYDSNFAFITGNNNTLIYTYDGGYTWQSVVIRNSIGGPIPTSNFNAVFVQDYYSSNPTTYLTVYFSLGSNQFTKFDVNISDINYLRPVGNALIKNITIYTASMSQINSIGASQNRVFIAGTKLAVYTSILSYISGTLHEYGGFEWTYIQVFDDLKAIAVGYNSETGQGILSSTLNGGVAWTDFIYNQTFNDVNFYDSTHAIAVGTAGTIMITADGGMNWRLMDTGLYNSSGKEYLLSHPSIWLTDIVVVDPDTILVANLNVPYIQDYQYGQSFVTSCFLPKYMNYGNNHVLDLCGNMQIYGDIHLRSTGKYITAESSSFELLNHNVNQLRFGGDCANIYVGNTTKSAIQTGGDLYVSGNIYTPGTLTCTTFMHVNENFEKIYCNHFECLPYEHDPSRVPNIDLISNSLFVYGNSILITNHGQTHGDIHIGDIPNGSYSDISISGKTDTLTIGGSVIMTQALNIKNDLEIEGNLVVDQDMYVSRNSVLNGNIFAHSNIDVLKNTTIGKELSVSGNVVISKNTNISGALTVNDQFYVYNPKGIIHLTSDNSSCNVGLGSFVMEKMSNGYHNVAIGNHALTQNYVNGNCNIGIGDHALYAVTEGAHNIGIGKQSATSITTGICNVAIGNVALGSSLYGKHNVAIGNNPFFTALNGDYNVTIGPYAMYNVNSGDDNVSIGHNSGYNYDNYVLHNCTFLGTNSRAQLQGGASYFGAPVSNSTAIGHDSIVTGDNQVVIGTSSDSMYIDCPTVSIGKHSTNYALDVNGVVNATSYNTSSDYRIKDHVLDISLSEINVNKLRPVSYYNKKTGKNEMGFIAHELAKVFPDLVSGDMDGEEYQSVNYLALIALLVKEIQDLKQKVNTLLP